jgi:hypothetical protein
MRVYVFMYILDAYMCFLGERYFYKYFLWKQTGGIKTCPVLRIS